MENLSIVLPISRADYLDSLFESLNALDTTGFNTKLFIIVDGDSRLYRRVKNTSVKMTKIVIKRVGTPATGIMDRRERIAEHHNHFKNIVPDGLVFGMEDDSIVPSDAVQRLSKGFEDPLAGVGYGVELGRWGVPYVGVWRMINDDRIDSMMPEDGSKCSAGGFYCFMTATFMYKNHQFKGLQSYGPDIEYGLECESRGLKNWVDWDIKVDHLTTRGPISIDNTKPERVSIVKVNNKWTNVKTKTL